MHAKRPPEVVRVLADARRLCRDAGGRRIQPGPGAVTLRDLNGDGRADAVVDFGEIKCSGLASVFCGTGGCLHVILMARPDGRLVEVFDGSIRAYTLTIDSATKAATIRFQVHGSYCDRAGVDDCFQARPLTTKPVTLDPKAFVAE